MELREITLTPKLDTLELTKIDDSIYFSPAYSHYVSNSRLGYINPKQDGTPDKFFYDMPKFNSASLAIGSAVHELCLQSDLFELVEGCGKPTAKLGLMADELYPIFIKRKITDEDVISASEAVDYYKGKMNSDRIKEVISKSTTYWNTRNSYEMNLSSNKEQIYLDNKSEQIVKNCVESVKNNTEIQKCMHPDFLIESPISENEQAILLDVDCKCPNGKEFTLHLKSKLDNYVINKEDNTITVNDIKTVGNILPKIEDNIQRFHYAREFGMYMYLLKLVAKKFYGMDNPKVQANYLVVSTIPSFYSKVRPVTYQELVKGFKEFQILLKYVAYNIGYKGYELKEKKNKFQI